MTQREVLIESPYSTLIWSIIIDYHSEWPNLFE